MYQSYDLNLVEERPLTYRVVQWATGAVGVWGLKQIIDHPDLELVGVWVSSDAKAGKDAGEIADRPPTGVIATTSREEILALDADVVIHTAVAVNADGHLPFDDDVEALLRSGKNVISTASYFSPRMDGPEITERMQKAATDAGVTLYGGGIDPGFVFDRVAATLTGSIHDIRQIRMIESQDVADHPSLTLLSEVGFGKKPEQLSMDSPGVQYYGGRLLCAAVGKLADQLGLEIDSVQPSRVEHVLAETDLETSIGTIKAGTISAVLHEFSAFRDGHAVIQHQWVTYMDRASVPDDWYLGPERREGEPKPYVARIEIEGKPNLVTEMVYTDPDDETSYSFPTAAVCINSIPDVVDAAPGLLQEEVFGRWRRA